jgi:hypothetical protein
MRPRIESPSQLFDLRATVCCVAGMTDLLQDIVDSAKDLEWQSISDTIFHSEYYPTFYLVHCIFVCVYLRSSAGVHGLQWWRSWLLGLVFSYGTRYLFLWLIDRFIIDRDVVLYYTGVWLAFNIFPYDLVYRFARRTVPLGLLALFAEFGNGQLVIHYAWNANNSFPDKVLKSLMVIATAYAFPMAIDSFDNIAFRPKRRFMFYPWTYLKRIIAQATVVMLATVPTPIWPHPYSHMYTLVPYNALVNGVLKLVDGVWAQNLFGVVDLVFPIEVIGFLGKFHGRSG